MNKKTLYKCLASGLFSAIIFLLSNNIPFFWDNIVGSKMAHHLYYNGLFNFHYPPKFDSGYPPFIPFVNALGWMIFGKKLWVSHFVFCIILFGFTWQLHSFIEKYFTNKWHQVICLSFVFCDATILAQTFYIGMEISQIFFFFLGLNAINNKNNFLKVISVMFLGLCSARGMMLGIGLFFIELYSFRNIHQFFRLIIPYSIAAIPSLAYSIWHIATQGYILQTNKNTEWGEHWQIVNFKGFLFNAMVLAHRFFDFSRVFVLLFLGLFIFKNKPVLKDKNVKFLLIGCLSSGCIIALVSLVFTNPMGHRYYAVSFVFIHILAVYTIIFYIKHKGFCIALLAMLLIFGNLWQYPAKYAQGWDASLRSLPYFSIYRQSVKYLHQKNINIYEAGTFGINKCSMEDVLLSGDSTSFAEFNGNNQYVFFSDIYNEKPQKYQEILKDYYLVKHFENMCIWIDILKRK